MKEWIKLKWKAYYKPIYRVAIFVVAAIIMVLSFPNIERMQYEYELQRPWRYENIIAPFDFPIYKTEHEITTERDSILSNFRPFYKRDSIETAEIGKMVHRAMSESSKRIEMICPPSVGIDSINGYIEYQLTKICKDVYERGVIDFQDQNEMGTRNDVELMVIEGNILEPYALSELLTMREAYSEITGKIEKMLVRRYGSSSWVSTLAEKLPISELIEANIIYDAERTSAERDQKLANMSLTSGMVMAGQKVISTGDIVDKRAVRLIESMKQAVDTQYGVISRSNQVLLGQFLVVLCLLSTIYLFLMFFRADIFKKLSNINFIILLTTCFVVGAGIISQRHGNISFVVPFVIVPIVMRIFLDSRLAMYVHTIMILIISFLAYNSQLFILLHIPAGMIAIISLVHLTRRGQIVRTSFLLFATYSLIYIGYIVWQTGEYESVNPYILLMFIVNSLLLLLSYPLIYIFEKMFGFISDVTLMELSDSNNELLRELSEKAPGTFQHSVQVANLAQEVAIRIGANDMMVRAGAMYHDIGKVVTPGYFTENQAGINPHDGMDYKESARMIINHVGNGIKLAQKFGIPQQIIDIIKTHHGRSQARYFFVSWCNEHKGETPDIESFSYPGPMPTTKEQAIVMMADAVEASSKSLTEYTEKSINDLVEKIIGMQIEQQQFKIAPITFRDIEVAKEIFKEKLKNIYHGRIQYPEMLK